jgi:uncharacterized membrane protein
VIWAILGAAAAVYSWKLLGYLIPERFFTPRLKQIADAITVALLAGLVVLQGFGAGTSLALDGRAAGLVVATGLLLCRAPFLVTILSAALTSVVAQQVVLWLGL